MSGRLEDPIETAQVEREKQATRTAQFERDEQGTREDVYCSRRSCFRPIAVRTPSGIYVRVKGGAAVEYEGRGSVQCGRCKQWTRVEA